MPRFEVTITRITNDAFPGFVECKFVDAHNQEHTLVEKAPVVSSGVVSAQSAFPLVGYVACEILSETTDEAGRVLVQVDTDRPYGIESVAGQTRFDLLARKVRT